VVAAASVVVVVAGVSVFSFVVGTYSYSVQMYC
jgi:hypothetical protein